MKLTFDNLLGEALVIALCQDNVHIRAIRGREIGQTKILSAIGGLIDRCSSARLVRLAFQPSGIERLWVSARSERRGLTDLLVDLKLLGAKGPPERAEDRQTDRDQNPLPT